MNRRSFLKLIGVAPVAVAAASGACVAAVPSRRMVPIHDELHRVPVYEISEDGKTVDLGWRMRPKRLTKAEFDRGDLGVYRYRKGELIPISEWKASS